MAILLVLWHASPAAAQISNAKPAAGETRRPPLVITVEGTSTAASLTVGEQIKLSDVGLPADSTFSWTVNETLSKPLRDLDGEIQKAAAGELLELTGDASAKKGVVSFKRSNPRFSPTQPIDISVTVNRPGALLPGVYRGDIWAELDSQQDSEGKGIELGRPLKLRWPVFIFVKGRSVKSIAFDDPKPRVGRPASLTVEIETVGCELGDGKLQVDSGGSEQELKLALHVLLNAANFKRLLIDPERGFYKDPFQAVNENWRLSALRIFHNPPPVKSPPELSLAAHKGTYPKVERHLIHVAAGDFYEPGLCRAKVDWPQADVAPTQPRVAIQQAKRITVLSGIRVYPRHAAENEGAHVLIAADGGLPSQFKLIAASSSAASFEIPVEDKTAPGVSGRATFRRFDGPFQTPPARGILTIGWPPPDQIAKLSKQDQKTYQILEAEVGQPTSVDVCFQSQANLASPLEVFASAEPIWWPFYRWNPLKATGWEYTRPKAIQFAAHPDHLKLARLTQAGWFEVLSDGHRVPYDAAAGNGPKLTIQSTEPAPAGPGPVWQIPEKGALALSATVSLHPKEPLDAERHRLGLRRYVWCSVLTGQDANNLPVVRIIEFPVNVVVTTSWYYDWYLYVGVGGSLVIVGAVLGLNYLRSHRRGRKGEKSKRTGKKGGPSGLESAEDQYFGGSPTGDVGPSDSGSESPQPPAKPTGKSEPESSPPPPTMPEPDTRDDDPGAYFS